MLSTGRGYAGIWLRALAFAYDCLVIAAYIVVLLCAVAAVHVYAPALTARIDDPVSGQLTGFFSVTLPVALYFAFLEGSPGEASWGKRRCGLRVAAVDGRRVRLGRSLLRTALKFIPWEIAHACAWRIWYGNSESTPWIEAGLLLVGVLAAANLASAAFTPRRQALHDLLAGTMVIRERG